MSWLRGVLSDPVLGRVIAIVAGLAVAIAGVRFGRRAVNRHVKDADSRYRARKVVTLTGYVLVLFYLSLVFRDRLGGLTLALGIIGAGIAFRPPGSGGQRGRVGDAHLRPVLPRGRPHRGRRRAGRRDRHRRAPDDAHGTRAVGARRPLLGAHRPHVQQRRLQGAGLQLLGGLPVPVGRDPRADSLWQPSRTDPCDAPGSGRGGRRVRCSSPLPRRPGRRW